ncbi:MAG: GspH/FimT family pseudopilin [Nitrospiria bacterium]
MPSRTALRVDSKRGYTAIELMIVLALTGILIVLGVSDYAAQITHHRLRSASHQIVANLRLIRQKAVTEGKSISIQFNPKTRQYRLPGIGERTLPQQIRFGALKDIKKSPSKNGSPPKDGISFKNDIVTFQPNGTYAGLGGTIYLTNTPNQNESMAITVNMTGRVTLYRWIGNAWQ